jgi:small-conductance mechanosensitive channel
VVVKPMPWPDYVFKPTYKLQPLKKVEQYIKTNHHLPDMPSADSVAAAGIDVGANQAALLKKIEELTLYVIEQNKKIDALTEQNKKLDTLAERIKQLEKHK